LAEADQLYVNRIITNIVGRHKVTWLVPGRRVVRVFWRQ
jgi:hypothetical protein